MKNQLAKIVILKKILIPIKTEKFYAKCRNFKELDTEGSKLYMKKKF